MERKEGKEGREKKREEGEEGEEGEEEEKKVTQRGAGDNAGNRVLGIFYSQLQKQSGWPPHTLGALFIASAQGAQRGQRGDPLVQEGPDLVITAPHPWRAGKKINAAATCACAPMYLGARN